MNENMVPFHHEKVFPIKCQINARNWIICKLTRSTLNFRHVYHQNWSQSISSRARGVIITTKKIHITYDLNFRFTCDMITTNSCFRKLICTADQSHDRHAKSQRYATGLADIQSSIFTCGPAKPQLQRATSYGRRVYSYVSLSSYKHNKSYPMMSLNHIYVHICP